MTYEHLTMHFDGGCYPNPGGRMTYGFHIDDDDGNRVAEGSGSPERYEHHERTNNTAELEALIAGLTWLAQAKCLTIDRLTVLGDSMLVVNWMNKKVSKVPHLKKLGLAAKELLKQIDAGHIELRWVPREQNGEADAIAEMCAASAEPATVETKSAWPAPWDR